MSARFRIRTPQGQEISFGSEEMFVDFVRAGDLSDDDLVYDASTGEWAPARTHSLVLAVRSGEWAASSPDGGAQGASTGQAGEAQQGTGDVDRSVTLPGGGALELSPEKSPEEAAAAFVERLEEERASEFERIEELRGLTPAARGERAMDAIEHTPPPPPPPTTPDQTPPPAPRSRRSAPTRGTLVGAGATAGAGRSAAGTRGGRKWTPVALIVGAVGVAVLFGPDLVGWATGGDADVDDTGTVTEIAVVPDTEEGLAERAGARFLGRVRGVVDGLPQIPRIWLDGRYLANASQYPEVRAAWENHLATVRRLRVDEEELYSQAYLTALDDARVTGPTRTLRLASALSRFQATAPARRAHYAKVEALAVAALDFHTFLLAREMEISYEPAVGTRISADPVLQAASTNPTVQREMEAALDRVLSALAAEGTGPVEAARVSDWTFDGLRDVVAPE